MAGWRPWEPVNNLSVEEKQEILNFMESLYSKKLYENTEELEDILEYVLRHFMDIEMNPQFDYDLELFNAYIDENLTEEECWYRFTCRTDTERYLRNGKRNINYMRKYWIII